MLATYLMATVGLWAQPLLATPVSGRAIECTFSTYTGSGDTCESFAKDWDTTVEKLRELNPTIDCSVALPDSVEYCVEGTGGEPITSKATTTTTTKQTSTTVSTPPENTCYKDAPENIQPGAACGCQKFHLVKDGTTCQGIIDYDKITADDFYRWNPKVGGSACTGLWLGYNVCVLGPNPHTPPTTATSAQPPQNTCYKNEPKNVQPGTLCGCDKFHLVKDGTTCQGIIDYDKINSDDFYRWNPKVGGKACTGLWLDYSVCVHGPNPHKPSNPPPPPPPPSCYSKPPSPVQPGAACKCKKWHQVGDKTTCDAIIKYDKIKADDFYKWNPKVGGTKCNGLWKGYYVCVGV